MRDLTIVVHAAAGVLAFLLGLALVGSAREGGRLASSWQLVAYLASLVLMAATLPLAIALDWSELETVARIAFLALLGLAAVMLWQADRARRLLPNPGREDRRRFIDRVGFTLISLFDGFVIVFVLGLDVPALLVVAIGVGAVGAGHLWLEAEKRAVA